MASVAMLHHNVGFDVTMGAGTEAVKAVRNLRKGTVMPETYRNEHGILVATSPCSWDEATRKIKAGDLIFGRTPEEAEIYKRNVDSIKHEWDSIDSYCRHRFLGYDYVTRSYATPGETPRNVMSVDANARPGRETCLVKNDFPYSLTPDVQHYLLWSTEPRPGTILAGIVEGSFPSEKYQSVIFENFAQNKSVKSVFHVHVFVRAREGPSGYRIRSTL